MNFVISGYNDNEYALTNFSFNNGNIIKKNCLILDNPSYVTSYNDVIFTYSKNPLYMMSIKNNKILDKVSLSLESMTHLTYSNKNKALYGASYKDGCIVRIGYDNKFNDVKYVNHKALYGDNSKCHAIILNEEESIVCCVNIATDTLYFYNPDLELIKAIKLNNGCGPRHAIWIKNIIYVVTEYSNELIVVDYNSGNAIYHSTLSPLFNGVSYGATLFEYNGYIYASNRGEESIAKFEILDNNDVKYLYAFPCNGCHPRHMICYKNILISCNKNSNNVSFIDLDTEKEIASIDYPNPSGVCIIE